MCNSWNWQIFILVATVGASLGVSAATKVGNGDDGRDLEKLSSVTSGPLVESRNKAVEILKRLDVPSLPGLSQLIPEVESAPLMLAAEDVTSDRTEKNGRDAMGRIYARTFPEPHAATRFFPVALKLDDEQLVALHIHEALHRALPAAHREDEDKVSQLTLALASTGTSYDRVKSVVNQVMPEQHPPTGPAQSAGSSSSSVATLVQPETPENYAYNSFTYSYRMFQRPETSSLYDSRGLHVIEANLYPFGEHSNGLGFGILSSYVNTEERSFMGPLGISARGRLFSRRGFLVNWFGQVNINTASDDIKNSPIYRDVTSLGLEARKETRYLYLEGRLTHYRGSSTTQNVGGVMYTYDYGAATGASIKVGGHLKQFHLGGSAEWLVADAFRVKGGAYSGFDSGRYRLFSAGPDLSWSAEDFEWVVQGRLILDRTEDSSYDYFGDLLGHGAGQGYVSTSVVFKL